MYDALVKNTLVPLILRFGLAVIFIYHGIGKVSGDGTEFGAAWSKGPDALPAIEQVMVAWGELIGGIALGAGFLTRFAAIGISIIMIGAIWKFHGPKGFSLPGGYEYNFAILVMCACLILGGGGSLALDRFIRIRRR